MSQEAKHRHLKNLIAVSFLLGVLIGLSSNGIEPGDLQKLLWGLSSFFIIIGAALLGSKLSREGHDIPAAGFTLLAIGEAMGYGFLATHDTGLDQFGAAIIIFVPGLLLISIYGQSPIWIRILGLLSAASFAILTTMIYLRTLTPVTQMIFSAIGYTAMNIMLLAWAWRLYKNKV